MTTLIRPRPYAVVLQCLQLINCRYAPAATLVIEFKCNLSADTAIDQIKRKEYTGKVSEYVGDILLIGISYNRQTKRHQCRIEEAILL